MVNGELKNYAAFDCPWADRLDPECAPNLKGPLVGCTPTQRTWSKGPEDAFSTH